MLRTCHFSWTLSSPTAVLRLTGVCFGRTVELPLDHRQLLLFATLSPRLRMFSGIKPFLRCDFIYLALEFFWHQRYVDTRFILLRSSAPPAELLTNFLSLVCYRPPVLLEAQHDTKVLGHLCDSLARTINPQLPEHPSQIKGVRSANDEIFTYSSWSSRSWHNTHKRTHSYTHTHTRTHTHAHTRPHVPAHAPAHARDEKWMEAGCGHLSMENVWNIGVKGHAGCAKFTGDAVSAVFFRVCAFACLRARACVCAFACARVSQ